MPTKYQIMSAVLREQTKEIVKNTEDKFKVRLDFLGMDVENWMMWKRK